METDLIQAAVIANYICNSVAESNSFDVKLSYLCKTDYVSLSSVFL